MKLFKYEMDEKLRKRMWRVAIILLVIFGGIIAFNIIKGGMIKYFFAHYIPPAITVSSVTARQQNWEPHIHAVGNFVAINGVELNSQAAGNVVAIHFKSGQYIHENDPLIDIYDAVDQASLKSNQSELALQEISYQRQVSLFKHGATSNSSVDEAKAKLLQAQAEVEKTQSLIYQKHITAPFSGQLGIRQVNLGQYVTPGQTTIASLQSMDPLYLNFYLPEQLFNQLHINQPITFSVEQNPHLLFEGKISAINSKVDISTHNIQVQATVANCPNVAMKDPLHSPFIKIKKQSNSDKILVNCDSELNKKNKIEQFTFIPGMFASIEVEQPSIPNVIVLPTTAISYSLYGNSVYIIEKKNAENEEDKNIFIAKRVFISTGDQQGNYTVIRRGVKAGQTVVSSGELKLQDGTRVVINNEVQLKDTQNPATLGE